MAKFMFTNSHPFPGEREGCNGQIRDEAIAEALSPTREAGQCGHCSLLVKGRRW